MENRARIFKRYNCPSVTITINIAIAAKRNIRFLSASPISLIWSTYDMENRKKRKSAIFGWRPTHTHTPSERTINAFHSNRLSSSCSAKHRPKIVSEIEQALKRSRTNNAKDSETDSKKSKRSALGRSVLKIDLCAPNVYCLPLAKIPLCSKSFETHMSFIFQADLK